MQAWRRRRGGGDAWAALRDTADAACGLRACVRGCPLAGNGIVPEMVVECICEGVIGCDVFRGAVFASSGASPEPFEHSDRQSWRLARGPRRRVPGGQHPPQLATDTRNGWWIHGSPLLQKKGGKAGGAAADDGAPETVDAGGPNGEEGGDKAEVAAQLPADPFAVGDAPAPEVAAETAAPEEPAAPVKMEEPAKKTAEAPVAPAAAETATTPVPAHQGEPKGEEEHDVHTTTSTPGDCFQALVPGLMGVRPLPLSLGPHGAPAALTCLTPAACSSPPGAGGVQQLRRAQGGATRARRGGQGGGEGLSPYWGARVASKWNHGRILLRSARRRALPEAAWTVEDFRKMHALVTWIDTIKILLALCFLLSPAITWPSGLRRRIWGVTPNLV